MSHFPAWRERSRGHQLVLQRSHHPCPGNLPVWQEHTRTRGTWPLRERFSESCTRFDAGIWPNSCSPVYSWPRPSRGESQDIHNRSGILVGRFHHGAASAKIECEFKQGIWRFMALKKTTNIHHGGKRVSEILEAHERFFSGKKDGIRADLTGADLSGADLSGANLSGAILQNANLEGADLRRARLAHADLSGANLRKADLRNTDLTEAILPGANFEEAQASGVEFFRCDLSNTNFRRALLRNANFRLANVNGATFSGADMGVTILRETDLTGADLSGVDLSTTLMPRNYSVPQAASQRKSIRRKS